MAAGFRALRDDDVGAVLLEPDRFLHDGCRRHHDAAGRLDALEQRPVRQAEMEADDLGLQLFDDLTKCGIERRAIGGVDWRRRVEPEFPVIGCQPLPPACFALGVGIFSLVAEEVHVDRSRCALADDVDLLARLLGRQHRARQRSQCAALRCRDHEFGVHHARHRCEHDRKFGLEELDNSAIRPHGLLVRLDGHVSAEAAREAVAELRRPRSICSASVTIRPTISAAVGTS